jgi:hypothetical protein
VISPAMASILEALAAQLRTAAAEREPGPPAASIVPGPASSTGVTCRP